MLELGLGLGQLAVGALELAVGGEQRRVLRHHLALEEPALRGIAGHVGGDRAMLGGLDVRDLHGHVDRIAIAPAEHEVFVATGQADVALGVEDQVAQLGPDQDVEGTRQHVRRAHIRRHDATSGAGDDLRRVRARLEEEPEHRMRDPVCHTSVFGRFQGPSSLPTIA